MLVSLGLDFRRARLEVRERFHLEDRDVARIYGALAAAGARETVLTRTCNRVETYCWWPDAERAAEADPGTEIARRIGRIWAGPREAESLLAHATLRREDEVVRHLLRVAAGLESQILGDMHILGQLRRAFREAIEARVVGSTLHRLFETALRVGKQVKRETGLTAARNGVGSEAARRAAAHFGNLAGRPCVVVGCGKSGTHAARSLAELGARDLTLVNRTVPRAEKLAGELGRGRAMGLDGLPDALVRAEVLVVATGARTPILTRAELAAARCHALAPLLVLDVSVPRNVEPAVGALPAVELVDLDALHPEAARVEKTRAAAVPEAEVRVERGVEEYLRWQELEGARLALRPLREVLADACRREVAHLAGESPLAERAAERIVARVMAHPMAALRAASARGEPVEEAADALGVLFAEARLA